MIRTAVLVLLLATTVVLAADAPAAGHDTKPATKAEKSEKPEKPDKTEKKEDGKLGMSILGNQEAPKALVIVPWKSSQLGAAHGLSPMFDDSRLPVDKDVFMRALSYYEIRSDDKRGP